MLIQTNRLKRYNNDLHISLLLVDGYIVESTVILLLLCFIISFDCQVLWQNEIQSKGVKGVEKYRPNNKNTTIKAKKIQNETRIFDVFF